MSPTTHEFQTLRLPSILDVHIRPLVDVHFQPLFDVHFRPPSVLQSTPPVLLRTTKYSSSTTPYDKVLLQYYSVLQSTTPVLLRTTKYYSVLQSATLYYKVLLQYYSVLQSITPACKTSISCEASATFQATSFQKEHFLRGFRNFSSNRLPK